MRKLIESLQKLTEALDNDAEEGAELAQKYGFGTVEWQDAMMARIERKVKNKEKLTGLDYAFMEIQMAHHEHVRDELKAMGVPDGEFNVN